MGLDCRVTRNDSTRFVELAAAALRLLSRQRRSRFWDRLGRFFARMRRPLCALIFYRRATSLDPGRLGPWRRRTAAAVRAGRLGEAAFCCRSLLRLEPQNPRAHARLAAIYDSVDAARAALDICRRALRRFPDTLALHRQFGRLLLRTGSADAALHVLQRAAQEVPHHADTQYFIALAFRQTGHLKEARSALRRALSLNPEDPKLYYALGLCSNPAECEESAELLLEGLAAEHLAADRAALHGLSAGLDPPQWTAGGR